MNEEIVSLPTVGLLVLKDRKLLLAFSNNKQCFYLPGGKIDPGESAASALCREIAEELNLVLAEKELHYYTHITAPAYGEKKGVIMEQDCFLLNRQVDPIPSAEIGELKFFSLKDYLQQQQIAPGTVLILEQLQSEGLID